MSVKKICDDYLSLRAQYELAKEHAASLHAAMQHAKVALIDAMLAEGMKGYPRDDGIRITLKRSFQCSVTQENQDAIREWLLEEQGDDAPYVKEVVDKQALLVLLKEQHEKGTELPEFLRVSARPDLSVSGWKNRREEESDD